MRTVFFKEIRLLLFAVMISLPLLMEAQEADNTEVLRPVMSAYTFEIGSANNADTYLSPIKYQGWTMGLRYERMQAMKFNPENWIMRLTAEVRIDRTMNKVRNAAMWYSGVYFDWGMMKRYALKENLTIGYGASASFTGGALYLNRNGNNPVSAKAALTLNFTGYAAWNSKIGRTPITIIYQPVLPVTGVFFSPEYGELYYEIYIGNRSGLVHPAWWGNYFSLINRLTCDFHFGATSLRIGYSSNILSTKVNNITTRVIRNEAIVGISGEWISLNPRKNLSPKAKMIRAVWK